MSLSDALPPQEKYLISGQPLPDRQRHRRRRSRRTRTSPRRRPTARWCSSISAGSTSRAATFDKARQHFAKVVELDPKFVEGLLALGRVEIKRGNPQDALEPLNTALTLAIQLNNDEARANILQAIGIAYKQLDRPDEALTQLSGVARDQAAARQQARDGRAVSARSRRSRSGQGKLKEAEQSYRAALKLQREIGDKSGHRASRSSISRRCSTKRSAGPTTRCRSCARRCRFGATPAIQVGEALVLNNIGNVYLAKGDYAEAQTYFERALEIREKANVRPKDLADTLHNLGETLSKDGRYDQALAQYLRAIDLRRNAGDKRGAAIESYSMGTVFDYQGRYGAAVKSKEEALQSFRELNQKDAWLGEILSGYGYSLSLAGRKDDAAKPLDEALGVARALQNPVLVAQTLRFQTARLFYAGDDKGAVTLADQATEAASKASDKSLQLAAQVMAATTAAAGQPTQALAARLAKLSQDADAIGLPSMAVECTVAQAGVLLKLGDRAGSRREADRALARAETLGFRVLAAKAHYLRAEAMRASGDAEAKREYGLAVRLLNDLSREDGNQNVLKRADLAAIYEDAKARS